MFKKIKEKKEKKAFINENIDDLTSYFYWTDFIHYDVKEIKERLKPFTLKDLKDFIADYNNLRYR